MAWSFDPSTWSDGTTIPHAVDFQHIAANIHTWGGNVDAATNQLTNLAALLLSGNGSSLTGTELTLAGITKATTATLASVLLTSSGDSTSPLQASFLLVGDATAANRRLAIECVEQGVAFRSLTLNESGAAVGIGLSAPLVPLHVFGNGATEVARFQPTDTSANQRSFISLYTTNPTFWFEFSNEDPSGGGTANGLAFRERSGSGASICRMYVKMGGNVGIGTQSPTSPLQVVGLTTFASDSAAGSGGLTAGALYKDSSGGVHVKL